MRQHHPQTHLSLSVLAAVSPVAYKGDIRIKAVILRVKALCVQLFIVDKSHLYQLRLSYSAKWLSIWTYNINVTIASTGEIFFRWTTLIKWYQFIEFRPALRKQAVFCSFCWEHYVLLYVYTQLSSFHICASAPFKHSLQPPFNLQGGKSNTSLFLLLSLSPSSWQLL